MMIIIECACFCLSHRQHVTGAFVISLAPAALWSESSHIQNIMSLGVFFLQKEVAENHLHTSLQIQKNILIVCLLTVKGI